MLMYANMWYYNFLLFNNINEQWVHITYLFMYNKYFKL